MKYSQSLYKTVANGVIDPLRFHVNMLPSLDHLRCSRRIILPLSILNSYYMIYYEAAILLKSSTIMELDGSTNKLNFLLLGRLVR